MKNVMHKAKLFKEQIPDKIKNEIGNVEEEARLTRDNIEEEEVRQDFEDFLLDPGYHRGRVALHQKTLDLAWTMKFLMGKALMQQGEEHEAILLTLDEILANQ